MQLLGCPSSNIYSFIFYLLPSVLRTLFISISTFFSAANWLALHVYAIFSICLQNLHSSCHDFAMVVLALRHFRQFSERIRKGVEKKHTKRLPSLENCLAAQSCGGGDDGSAFIYVNVNLFIYSTFLCTLCAFVCGVVARFFHDSTPSRRCGSTLNACNTIYFTSIHS